MFTFDWKPRQSSAHAPASKQASQQPVKAPVSPLWFRLATSSNVGAAASPEERQRYLEPHLPALVSASWSRVGHAGRKAKVEADGSPSVALSPQFDFARMPIMPPIQRKATISSPGDPCEREADEVAGKVMRIAEPASVGPTPAMTQRKCAKCEGEGKTIQPDSTPLASSGAALHVEAAVRATESGGEPLPEATREFFEPRFGHDFSGVRIHTGPKAAKSADAFGALAYTVGSHIVFGAARFSPQTEVGRNLLAHELTHTIQQSSAPSARVRPDGAHAVITQQPPMLARDVDPPAKKDHTVDFARLGPMEINALLKELDGLNQQYLSELRESSAQSAPYGRDRLEIAMDAVWLKKYGQDYRTEMFLILETRMRSALPFEDQQNAIRNYVDQANQAPAATEPAAAGVPSSFTKHTYALSQTPIPVVKANEKGKLAEVSESPDTYARAIIKLAGLDPVAWFGSFATIKFLGRSITDPIHSDLAAHLKGVERMFADQYGGPSKDPVEAGKALGLDQDIGGSRTAPTSATLSMHLFGLAIDVNYTSNPFISSSANPVFERAGLLVQGTKVAYQDNMSYDDLKVLDMVLEKYFSHLDNTAVLEARLKEAKDAFWSGKAVAEAQALIQADLKLVAGKWERAGSKEVIKKGGFLNLSKEFVSGIGLSWGASYGDMMHFDMRNKGNGAKIQSAIGQYKNQKVQEAKDKWAKEHGEQ